MDEKTRTTSQAEHEDELGPAERRKAAAQILARGIRRLLTRVALAREDAQSSSRPLENMEKVALPGVPSRALMTTTKAG